MKKTTAVARWNDDVYVFIVDYMRQTESTPTLREIGAKFGFSHTYAGDVVRLLVKQGRLKLIPQAHRNIRLVDTRKG